MIMSSLKSNVEKKIPARGSDGTDHTLAQPGEFCWEITMVINPVAGAVTKPLEGCSPTTGIHQPEIGHYPAAAVVPPGCGDL